MKATARLTWPLVKMTLTPVAVRAVINSDGIHPVDLVVWCQDASVSALCHARSYRTLWVLPTQSLLPANPCYTHVTQMWRLKLWGDGYFICSVSKSWEIRTHIPLTPSLYFLPHWPSIPNLKVPKGTFIICAMLLLTWSLKDPAKWLSRQHVGKIILFYTFVSGSFTRFWVTYLRCNWHLYSVTGNYLPFPSPELNSSRWMGCDKVTLKMELE